MVISRSTPPASNSDLKLEEYIMLKSLAAMWLGYDRNIKHAETNIYLENSGCFLITSLSVAKTAAIVSSEVPWSCCGLTDGSF